VYIDAFNLYFGCLKGTPYKWLNIAELCRLSLPAHYHVNRIRYFTALVTPRPANPQAHVRQQTLLRALQTLPNVTIHYGTFLAKTKRRPLTTPVAGLPRFVDVFDTEEKGSDVNLATYLLFDAFKNEYDAAVVVSDDSDLVEPIRIVRREFHKHVRVLSPRGKSRQLSLAATRFQQITVAALRAAQFPTTLTDAVGTITKPAGW
jgi:uncharacterized LabA/DUF88 family protein